MNVRRKYIRVIQCADPNIMNSVFDRAVVTPQGNVAVGAARNTLSATAICRSIDHLHLALQHGQLRGFQQTVKCKGGTGFALTPATMAAVHEQGRPCACGSGLPRRCSLLRTRLYPSLVKPPQQSTSGIHMNISINHILYISLHCPAPAPRGISFHSGPFS